METLVAPKVTNIFAKDGGATGSEKLLMRVLLQAKGQKTVDEIAADLGRAKGKPIKSGSITTAISQLRKRFSTPFEGHPQGMPFAIKGQSLEPKHSGGQGRRSERTDMSDVLDELAALVGE